MFEVGSAVARFTADIDDFQKGVKTVQGQLEKTTDASKEFAAGFLKVTAVAGAAAVGFGLKSVKSFEESEQASAQLKAVIKSTGGAAGFTAEAFQDMATEIQNGTGISDEAVLSTQSMLMTFTNITGRVFERATSTVADMATALNGGAIPSAEAMRAQSIQLGKALNDPINGISALTRVGVTFSEKQKDAIQKLVETGKTAEAQKIILNELATEFGGSARAAGETFAGQLSIANETLGNFMEIVGEAIVNFLRPMIESFNVWTESMGGPEGMLNALIAKIQEFNMWLREHMLIVSIVAGAIAGPLVVAFLAWAAAALVAAVNTLIALAPIILIGAAIGALAYVVVTNWATIKGAFESGWQSLKKVFDNITDGLNGLVNAFKSKFDSIKNTVTGSVDKVKDMLDKINPFHRESPSLVDNVTKGVDTIQNQFGKLSSETNILPLAGAGNIPGMGSANNVTINMAGANIGTIEVANEFAERVGDKIVDILTSRVRA